LPVVAYRDGHDALKVEIDARIDTRQAATETASVVAAHREYVARLERFVLAYPGQWRGWFQLSDANKFQPTK
jgi:predicted LPLAT superfamily acyltransferase